MLLGTWSKMRTKIQAGCKMEPKVAVCGGLVGFALGFPRELRRCTDGLRHCLLPNLPCMHAAGSFIDRWEEQVGSFLHCLELSRRRGCGQDARWNRWEMEQIQEAYGSRCAGGRPEEEAEPGDRARGPEQEVEGATRCGELVHLL